MRKSGQKIFRKGIVYPALIVSLALAFILPGLLPGKTLVPSVLLGDYVPWKSAGSAGTAEMKVQTDLIFAIHPWMSWAAGKIREGILPLWNPHSFGGAPFLGNLQSALFSPFNLFAWITGLPLAAGLGMLAKLVVAGLSMNWFLGLSGLAPLPALMGSVTFMFGGFMVSWLGWPHAGVAAWLPLMFGLAEKVVRGGSGKAAALLSVVTCLQFFGGNPEESLHLTLAVLAYSVVAREGGKWRGPVVVLASLTAGFLLAGIQLFPFLDYLSGSCAFRERMSADAARTIDFKNLALFVFPYYFGHPGHLFSWPSGWASNYNETCGFSGVVPLVLALGAVVVRRRDWRVLFFVALSVVSFVAIYPVPGISRLLNMLPFLNVSANTRLLLLLGFGLAYLGAVGMDLLMREGAKKMRGYILASAAIILVSAWALVFHDRVAMAGAGLSRAVCLEAGFYSALLVLAAGAAWILPGKKAMTAAIVLVAIQVASLLPRAREQWPIMPAGSSPFPKTGAIEYLESRPGLFRVLFPVPNLSAVYGLYDLSGYDAMNPCLTSDLITGDFQGGKPGGATIMFRRSPGVALADLCNVEYVVLPSGASAPAERYKLGYDGKDARVFRNAGVMPRAFLMGRARRCADGAESLSLMADGFDFRKEVLIEGDGQVKATGEASGGKAEITRYEPNRVVVKTESSGSAWLVLTDTWFRGWTARVNGKPEEIRRAYHAFRAVRVPAGKNVVEFRYKPGSFLFGFLMSLMGVVMTMALVVGRKGK
jgi:hypothetical protein